MFVSVELQGNDGAVQAAFDLHQECCDEESFGEIDKLYSGLHQYFKKC